MGIKFRTRNGLAFTDGQRLVLRHAVGSARQIATTLPASYGWQNAIPQLSPASQARVRPSGAPGNLPWLRKTARAYDASDDAYTWPTDQTTIGASLPARTAPSNLPAGVSRMLVRLLGLALLCLSLPAAAWDNRGHRATAELAYDRLQAADPAAVTAIVAIMAQHPDRARFDRNLAGLTGEARTRRMFGLMARWPDDIRDTAWDRPEWHYALKVAHGWTWLDWYTAGDAEEQWAANLATARAAGARAADRAVALCWMLHIGGDMHQPLHRGHRLDWEWLKSDRVGTIAFVRRGPGQPPMELHELWDKAFDPTGTGGGDENGDVDRLHAAFAPRAAALVSRGSFAQWIDESETLARTRAYTGPALAATNAPADAPPVTPAYMAMLRAIAEVRLTNAGVRMGNSLVGLR